jgi:hypothetical protein
MPQEEEEEEEEEEAPPSIKTLRDLGRTLPYI